ncbi:MAG: hypothetical protein HWN80_05285 [Candidatus Lokiarchaeota archaeon]|nr:hypothetical protein [Candidatus Lokiarchaeota archaeon]
MVKILNSIEKGKEDVKIETAKVSIIVNSILIYILITFISIIVLNFWGLLLFRDIDFLLGSIISVFFAMKKRKPDQSPLKMGIMVGIFGGFLSTIAPTIFICTVYQLPIDWYFLYIAILSITGLVIGSIVGLLMGYYYKKKDAKTKYSKNDEFYQGLIGI